MHDPTLWTVEQQLWTAGADLFEERLDAGAVLVCSTHGALDRRTFIDLVRQQPYAQSARLANRHSYSPSNDVAVLAYDVHAIKNDGDYYGRCRSTYVRINGIWLLAMHNQLQLTAADAEADGLIGSPDRSITARLLGPLVHPLTHAFEPGPGPI